MSTKTHVVKSFDGELNQVPPEESVGLIFQMAEVAQQMLQTVVETYHG